jgi:hypothetical protein
MHSEDDETDAVHNNKRRGMVLQVLSTVCKRNMQYRSWPTQVAQGGKSKNKG